MTVKEAPLFPQKQVARYLGQISSSLLRGYINVLTAKGLLKLLRKQLDAAPGSPSIQDAFRSAQTIYDIVRKQPGEQMRDIPEQEEVLIRSEMRKLTHVVFNIELPTQGKSAKAAKAPRDLMGITFDEGDSRMIHYCKRQIGRFLNKFPDPSPMDVTQYVTRFLYGNLPPVIRERLKDLMRTAETAPTGELRRFYVMRLLQLLNSGRPHQVMQRLKQPYAPGPGKSAKATVVKSAKAHGVKRELPPYNPPRFVQNGVGLSVRPVVSRLVVQIRASLQRGYVNIDTADRLRSYLRSNAIDIHELGIAARLAQEIYSALAKQPGEQMKDVNSTVSGYITSRLKQIVESIQSIS